MSKLNIRQRKFGQLYATEKGFSGNGVRSYAEVYGIDLSTKKGYQTAKANASRLLKNPDMQVHINQLLGLKEQTADNPPTEPTTEQSVELPKKAKEPPQPLTDQERYIQQLYM